MNKIEVRIETIAHAKSQVGNFVLILSELSNNNKKIPIVIKPTDAQFITVKMENVRTPRPMTQDLFKILTEGYNISIQEVFIHNVIDGIYYARLKTASSRESFDIDCTVGDALSMSVLYNCPIYVSEDVMEISGVDTSLGIKNISAPPLKMKEIQTIDDLNIKLQIALEEEDYETAIELRDKIAKLNVK